MKIAVHYSTKTGTIKKAFSKKFPYLKIEFLRSANVKAEPESWMNMVLHNRYVGEINKGLKEGFIDIAEDHKVASIEQLFQQNFGLPVLVLVRQKKSWIKVNEPGELTLSQQNEKGKESCLAIGSEKNTENNYGYIMKYESEVSNKLEAA
ncbi:MAG: hypothetical protein ABI402_10970 [Ferruginibacter sp.]